MRTGFLPFLLHHPPPRGERVRMLAHAQRRDGGGSLIARQAAVTEGGVYHELPSLHFECEDGIGPTRCVGFGTGFHWRP